MDLEIIILSEVSHRKTNIYHLYVKSKKMIQMKSRNRPTDTGKNLRLPQGKGQG